jgi:hypothetical protein
LITIELASDDGAVGSGGSGSRYMTATDGTRWVMKATYFGGQSHRYLYLNEAVGASIAVGLGISVPKPAVLKLDLAQAQVYKANAPSSRSSGLSHANPCLRKLPMVLTAQRSPAFSDLAGKVEGVYRTFILTANGGW